MRALAVAAVLALALSSAGCLEAGKAIAAQIEDGLNEPSGPTTHDVDLKGMSFQLGPWPNAQLEYGFDAPANTTAFRIEVTFSLKASVGGRISGACEKAMGVAAVPAPLGTNTEVVTCEGHEGPGSVIVAQDAGRMMGEIHVVAIVAGHA